MSTRSDSDSYSSTYPDSGYNSRESNPPKGFGGKSSKINEFVVADGKSSTFRSEIKVYQSCVVHERHARSYEPDAPTPSYNAHHTHREKDKEKSRK